MISTSFSRFLGVTGVVTVVVNLPRTNDYIRGYSKKVYHDLDHVEKCGFLHGVQHVSNTIFKVFLDIANF